MDRQRESTSNSSEGVRWSLDSIELEQPSLRLITPGEDNHNTETHTASVTSVSGPTPSDSSTQSSGKIDDNANPKTEGDAQIADAQIAEVHFRTHARVKNRFILLEWWEEILSLAVAIICTALSVAVLVYMNGRSLEEWKLPLQPNTLVAFLATITRAALIYPLAECLGNLKWRYFERPRTLAHFQTFDAASRGPLGALKYLWTLPVHSPLASFAALITTLLLLFQPFAQQTMSFVSRAAPMSNETAQVFRAMSWKIGSGDALPASAEPVDPAIRSAAYKAISNVVADGSNRGYCSTSLCEFENYDTLAICSECEQRVLGGSIETLYDECLWWNRSASDDMYNVFGVRTDLLDQTTNKSLTKFVFREIEKRRSDETFELVVDCGPSNPRVSSIFPTALPPTMRLEIDNDATVSPAHTLIRIVPFGTYKIHPWFQLWSTEDQTFWYRMFLDSRKITNPKAENAALNACSNYGGAEEDLLTPTCLSLSTDLNLWFRGYTLSDQFGVFNGTETNCSLNPCVQRVEGAKLQNNKYTSDKISHDRRRYYSGEGEPWCSGDEDECLYSWNPFALDYLADVLHSTIDTTSFYTMYWSEKSRPGTDYASFYQRVAAQMTKVLQSQVNPDVVNFTGVAYGLEIYVQVRWLWFILPLLLLASTLLIVVLSIRDSSRKNYLFKNNFLAAIAFELHGWEPHEYGVDGTWSRQSMRNVEKKAERMTARMQLPRDGDGGLRLKKE